MLPTKRPPVRRDVGAPNPVHPRLELSKREIVWSRSELSPLGADPEAVRPLICPACAMSGVVLGSTAARSSRRTCWEDGMTWKTPRIVEVPVGMEINMYACAARK
jgi:coenzyme PQQ precursor peptide PqqA